MDSHILHTDRRSSFGLDHKRVTRKMGGNKKGNAKGNKQKGQQGNANNSVQRIKEMEKDLERLRERQRQKLEIDTAVADEIAQHPDAVDDPSLFKQYYGDEIQRNHDTVEQNKQNRKNLNEQIENAIKQARANFQTEKDELNAIKSKCHMYTQVMEKGFPKSYKAWKKEAKAPVPPAGAGEGGDGEADAVANNAEGETPISNPSESRFGSLPAYLRPLKAI